MSAYRWPLLLTALALGAGAVGQESPPAGQTAPAPAAPESPPAPSRPPEPRAAQGGEDVFVPSEEIAADEEVVFPVDI